MTLFPRFVRWVLSLPGRCASILSRKGNPLPLAPLALTDAERSARKGNRGNNYLALEPDTRRFGSSENWLSFAASGRTLLSVGGLHGDEREALLRNWVTVGQEQGFRQFLLFPVHSSEREEVEASGFSTLVVGSEALLYLPDFKLDGSARRNLRQTIARASRVSGLAFREVSTAERGILLPVFSGVACQSIATTNDGKTRRKAGVYAATRPSLLCGILR